MRFLLNFLNSGIVVWLHEFAKSWDKGLYQQKKICYYEHQYSSNMIVFGPVRQFLYGYPWKGRYNKNVHDQREEEVSFARRS